jgi:hypothetical protein
MYVMISPNSLLGKLILSFFLIEASAKMFWLVLVGISLSKDSFLGTFGTVCQ